MLLIQGGLVKTIAGEDIQNGQVLIDGGKIVARKRLYVVVGVGGEKFVHVVSLLLHLVSGKGGELVGAVDVVAPMAQLGNFRGIESTEVVDTLLGDG